MQTYNKQRPKISKHDKSRTHKEYEWTNLDFNCGGFFVFTFGFPINNSSVDIGDELLKPSTSQFHV